MLCLSRLPVELQDMILDLLHDDKPALCTCARVCKAWLPVIRTRLFSKIDLRGSAQTTLLLAALTSQPALSRLITHLTLTGAHKWPVLLKLLRKLDALAHLYVRALPAGCRPQDARWADKFYALLLAMPHLRTLDMRPGPLNLSRQPCFSNGTLGSKTLNAAHAGTLLAGATGLAKLESMHLDPVLGSHVPALLQQAVAEAQWGVEGAVPLRYLGCVIEIADYEDPSGQAVDAFNSLLESTGDGLLHLVLFFQSRSYHMDGDLYLQRTAEKLRLSSMSPLRKLELVFPVDHHYCTVCREDLQFTLAVSVIAALPRDAMLSELVLTIRLEVHGGSFETDNYTESHSEAWAQLDEAICGVPRLRRVTVRSCRKSEAGADVVSAMAKALTQTQTRTKKGLDFELILKQYALEDIPM